MHKSWGVFDIDHLAYFCMGNIQSQAENFSVGLANMDKARGNKRMDQTYRA